MYMFIYQAKVCNGFGKYFLETKYDLGYNRKKCTFLFYSSYYFSTVKSPFRGFFMLIEGSSGHCVWLENGIQTLEILWC